MNKYIHKIDFKTTINPIDQAAMIEMNRIAGEHRERMGNLYINTKEKAIREALIALEWTPPEGRWQPADTAPKDVAFLAGWFGQIQLVDVKTVQVIQWHEGFGCWRGDRPGPVSDWTHWCSLPLPPQ